MASISPQYADALRDVELFIRLEAYAGATRAFDSCRIATAAVFGERR
ncbi:hypothetical protein OG799_08895 [Micromonospora sp. NBC_00898]|nr:hypothetical protein OG799_08895 [Micromonospora sp. NBC_00898]